MVLEPVSARAPSGPNARLELLEQVSALLSAAPDYEETLRQVARLVVPSLADWCILDIVGEDGTVRRLEVAHADPARQGLANELRRFPAGPSNTASPASEALKSGQSSLYSDTIDELLVRASRTPEHLALVRALAPQSAMVVALVARGRTLGTLSVFSAESGRRYTEADLHVLEELARRCALSVDNARMLAAERRERASSQSLQAITAALSRALTPRDVADAIIQEGLPGIGANAGAVALLNDTGDALELVGAVGYPEAMVVGFTHQPLSASTPMAQAVTTRRPVWRDEQVDSATAFPDYARLNRTFSAGASLPLIAGERLLGAVALSFSEGRQFDERDRTFATALATQCALAMERARLYEGERDARAAAEEAQSRLAYLAEATSLLSSSLDYELTLTRAAELAVPRLADACIVDILNPDGSVRRLPMVFADSVPADLGAAIERLGPPRLGGSGGAADVLRTGEAIVVPHVTAEVLAATARDAEHLRILERARMTSTMIVPLTARSTVLGAMTLVMTANSGRTYKEVDARLARELATRAAFAIDNARLFDATRSAEQAAQAAIRARDEFLGIASHELRTPVAAIKALAQTLDRARRRDQLDPERLSRSLSQLLLSTDRLAGLTGDLLDVSLLQTGRLALDLQVFDVRTLVSELVEASRVQLDDSHSLVLSMAASCQVRVDRLRLEQVLVNLVENAVKYSPRGGEIRLALSASEAGIQISVQDHGIGLPPEQVERIFEPFGRASNASARHIQGMGLGLHICRRIIEQHGGRIWAESSGEDQGTTLRVWLPCHADARSE
jgi:signal transduction histidine kinase